MKVSIEIDRNELAKILINHVNMKLNVFAKDDDFTLHIDKESYKGFGHKISVTYEGTV